MKKWKRGVWVCFVLILLDALSFGVHLFDLRVRYMAAVSQGASAPFGVYALPALLGHGAALLLLLGAGGCCWWKAWRQNQEEKR